jgi:hypothetical protein
VEHKLETISSRKDKQSQFFAYAFISNSIFFGALTLVYYSFSESNFRPTVPNLNFRHPSSNSSEINANRTAQYNYLGEKRSLGKHSVASFSETYLKHSPSTEAMPIYESDFQGEALGDIRNNQLSNFVNQVENQLLKAKLERLNMIRFKIEQENHKKQNPLPNSDSAHLSH